MALSIAVNVVGGGVGDFPRIDATCFMTIRQRTDQVAQAISVGENFGRAVSVHSDVVPGRHDFAVFGFARVKPRADVSLGTGKNHQRFGAVLQFLPLRIGPGEVAVEGAIRALVRVKQQRQMTGLQALFPVGDQHSKAGAEYLLLQFMQIIDGEIAGRVHGNFPWRMRSS